MPPTREQFAKDMEEQLPKIMQEYKVTDPGELAYRIYQEKVLWQTTEKTYKETEKQLKENNAHVKEELREQMGKMDNVLKALEAVTNEAAILKIDQMNAQIERFFAIAQPCQQAFDTYTRHLQQTETSEQAYNLLDKFKKVFYKCVETFDTDDSDEIIHSIDRSTTNIRLANIAATLVEHASSDDEAKQRILKILETYTRLTQLYPQTMLNTTESQVRSAYEILKQIRQYFNIPHDRPTIDSLKRFHDEHVQLLTQCEQGEHERERLQALIRRLEDQLRTAPPVQQQPPIQPVPPGAQPAIQLAHPAAPRTYKRGNIPYFSGLTKENINEWLFLLEINFQTDAVDEQMKVGIAATYLRDLALTTYRRLTNEATQIISWQQLKDQLIKEYQPFDEQQKLRSELRNLRQTGNNYDDYQKRFSMCVNRIRNMSQEDQIAYFINGLQRRTQEELRIQRPQTLSRAIEIANCYEQRSSYDSTYHSSFPRSSFSRRNNNHNNNYNPSNFSNNNHYSNNNGNNNSNNNTSNDHSSAHNRPTNPQHTNNNNNPLSIVCYKCNRTGHYSSKCPLRQHASSQQNTHNNSRTNNNQQQNNNPPRARAYTINSTKNQIKSSALLTIAALINGKSVVCILDTGASSSIISTRLATQLQLNTYNTNRILETANENSASTCKQTDTLPVETYGTLVRIKFLVHGLPVNTDCLLGIDWFKKANVIADPTEGTITFKPKQICLKTNNIIDTDTAECFLLSTIDTPTEEELIDLEQSWSELEPIGEHVEVDLNHLTVQHATSMQKLLDDYKHIIATNYGQLGLCTIGEHRIILTDTKPIYQPPYRKSMAEREAIKAEIKKMLDANIIRPSKSPWSSPVILLNQHGKTRFCIDYRRLNAVTVRDSYPIPRIDDILDRLAGAKYFTTIDLKSGYWQIKLHEDSIQIAAFSTPDGHYEPLRASFGLTNMPSDFNRTVDQVFGDLNFVATFFDNITAFSHNWDSHLEHVRIVLARLAEYHLHINLPKCEWAKTEVKILGHIISQNEVKTDPEKTDAIKNLPAPKNVKELQRFLGMTGFYRKFIHHYADIAAPLFHLLKQNTEWQWTITCSEAFEQLRNKLVQSPILRQPVFERPFILYTDASGFALGAILAQFDEKNNEYVVAYASRGLKGAERHYGITEKECLAVLWGVKNFRIYLYGKKFKIITDHLALKWLMTISDPTGRLARWSLYLQTYDFDIIHRPGTKQQHVDLLSRIEEFKGYIDNKHLQQSYEPKKHIVKTTAYLCDDESFTPTPSSTGYVDPSIKQLDPHENQHLIYFLKYNQHPIGSSKNQQKIISKAARTYKLEDDQLKYLRNDRALIVPKVSERKLIIERAHLLGHFQTDTTVKRIQSIYYWPKMQDDVKTVVLNCLVCKRHQKTPQRFHRAQALPITGICDRIGIDLIFGLPPTTDGFVGILVITEYLSKYPYAVPIRSKSAIETARHLFNYISLFGPPKEILSDQGREFVNKVIEEMAKLSGVVHKVTSPYHPWTNGLTERYNQTLVNCLKKHAEEIDPVTWPDWLPFVLLAYRTMIHKTTNMTPTALMFGREMNRFEAWTNNHDDTIEAALEKRALQLHELIEVTYPDMLAHLKRNKSSK